MKNENVIVTKDERGTTIWIDGDVGIILSMITVYGKNSGLKLFIPKEKSYPNNPPNQENNDGKERA